MNSLRKAYIKINYNLKITLLIVVGVLLLLLGSIKVVFYQMEYQKENEIISQQKRVNSLVKISNKMMYLR